MENDNVSATDRSDGKRPCPGNGQTVWMRTLWPSEAEFVECWSEEIIKNGLPPALVDDSLFRKDLITTFCMGQITVCMYKGTTLGKRDTTLSHRDTFSTKIVPMTDKRLDEEGMARIKQRIQKVWDTIISDGWYLIYNLVCWRKIGNQLTNFLE